MKQILTEKHLGTDIEIQIVSNGSSAGDIREMFDYCRDFEDEFSRFKENSVLSRLNESKQGEVSARFLDLLSLSLSYKDKTGGYFSPFVDVAAIGYSTSFEKSVFTPSSKKNTQSDISISGNTVTLGENTSLDFGGIGKGYLVDKIKEKLEKKGYTDFCINAGGDIYAIGKSDSGDNWSIGVENPFDRTTLGVFMISGKAVNTSGAYKRNWEIAGDKFHHIVNPYTGKNTNEFMSVTVVSNSGGFGDAITKALWHIPFDGVAGFFRDNDIEGIVISKTGKIFLSPGMVEKYSFEKY